jgi:hypothetical protein
MSTPSEDKPIVKFDGAAEFFDIYGGDKNPAARVLALDHPIWGTEHVRTSRIVKINGDGSFETLNTRYVPVMTFQKQWLHNWNTPTL